MLLFALEVSFETLSSLLSACGDSSDDSSSNPANNSTCTTEAQSTADYTVTFNATWSSDTHPNDSFPGDPHFSPLVGALHNSDYSMWKEGEKASAGIKQMAETGATTSLKSEIEGKVSEGSVDQFLVASGPFDSPGNTSISFTAGDPCSLLSLTSMIAPSPDWFVGIADLDLYEGDSWLESQTITLYAWDAGTDSGTGYESSNAAETDPKAIAKFDSSPLKEGTAIGTFVIEKQ